MTTKSFSDLRKNSANFEDLAKTLKATETKKDYKDPRADYFWQATRDKAGNADALIRFLPAPPGEELPWVKYWSHGFENKANGKWLIDNCPTSIGLPCPICEDNGEHWNTGPDGEQFVRDRRSARKLHYIANVYVVRDIVNPQNDGKVFLFKYGAKIHGKIMACVDPEFKTDTPWNPSDLWQGANFKLRITKDVKSGFANFDLSAFDNRAPLLADDAALEKVWQSEYSLKQFIDPKEFKSYDDLKKRLDSVLGGKSSGAKSLSDQLEKQADQILAQDSNKTVKAPTAPVAEELESVDVSIDDSLESLRDLVS